MKTIILFLSLTLFIAITFVASKNFFENDSDISLKVLNILHNNNLSENTVQCTCKEKDKSGNTGVNTLNELKDLSKPKTRKYKMKARKRAKVDFPDDGYL